MPRHLPIVDTTPKVATVRNPVESTAPYESAASLFKALGDPVRLRLFDIIAGSAESLCVCHIPDVGVGQPTVSHHLRKLREAGLIVSERRGTWVHYRVTSLGRRTADALRRLRT